MKLLSFFFTISVCFSGFFLAPVRATAQSGRKEANPDPATEKFIRAIGTVLNDFPDNLRHITGELVLSQGEFENYACTIELPGAENCTITHYHSVGDTSASWQARMFTGEEFPKAAHAYSEIYNKLKKCYLMPADGSMLYLQGDWQPAKEDAAFTTSTLSIRTVDYRYKNVKVEIELLYLTTDWVININIVNKKPDDEPGS